MRTTHCAKHAAGERVACQSGKEVARTGVDRHVRTTGYYVGGIAVYMTLLAEQGQWFTSGVERHTFGLSAMNMASAGERRLRSCASVNEANIATPGWSSVVISIIAISAVKLAIISYSCKSADLQRYYLELLSCNKIICIGFGSVEKTAYSYTNKDVSQIY